MRRDDPAGRAARPELPTDDLPSPEVLDELLRAFSADGADERTLEGIDLSSPEVEQLLAPTSPTPPPGPRDDDPRPQVEVEVGGQDAVEVGGATASAVDAVDVSPGSARSGTADSAPADPSGEAGARRPEPLDGGDPSQPHQAPATGDDPAPPSEGVEAPGHEDPATAPTDRDEGDDPPAATTTTTTTTATTAAASNGGPPRTIVIDASADPPDAVYLAAGDPLLAASVGARGLVVDRVEPGEARPGDATVFIDDQAVEAGETISLADASSATRIEPRMRERRIAVKRAAGRKRLRWAFVVAAVLILIVAALAVLGSSLFAIDEVDVDGAVRADPVALQAVVDELVGTPVLRADTARAERQLESIPWVASARVTTQFPDGATIELRERTAVATYQGPDQRFRVLDIDGRVLEVVDAQPAEHLVITSPDAADLAPGQFSSQGFIAAANLVQALTPDVRVLAQSVAVTGNGSDLRMALTDGREVRFGPGRDLVSKLVRLQTRLEELASGGFQYVDVSTNEVTTG